MRRYIKLQMGILIFMCGFETLFVAVFMPFRERIENYVQILINSCQVTVLGLLLAIGIGMIDGSTDYMARAASIIQIIATLILLLNTIRAERAMFAAGFRKLVMVFRYCCGRRGPSKRRPAPSSLEADGQRQRQGGDAGTGGRSFAERIFGASEEEELTRREREELETEARRRNKLAEAYLQHAHGGAGAGGPYLAPPPPPASAPGRMAGANSERPTVYL
eukprot:tig00000042_g15514.t1